LDADGRAAGIVGISTDITERKASEEARARLAAIIESSDDAILSKDLNGVITTWNAGAERLFGYTAQEAVGQPVTMLIPPGRFEEEPDSLQRFRRGERVENYETVRRHKNGALLDVSLTISPVLDGQGRIVGASKIARDITARKLAEAQARQRAEELRASHDELERFNRLMVERELRMVELKKEVNQFCAHAGQPPRYPLDFGKEQP
jgi:PAS domain S-box-containing protein